MLASVICYHVLAGLLTAAVNLVLKLLDYIAYCQPGSNSVETRQFLVKIVYFEIGRLDLWCVLLSLLGGKLSLLLQACKMLTITLYFFSNFFCKFC